jgi:hypothetical protein
MLLSKADLLLVGHVPSRSMFWGAGPFRTFELALLRLALRMQLFSLYSAPVVFVLRGGSLPCTYSQTVRDVAQGGLPLAVSAIGVLGEVLALLSHSLRGSHRAACIYAASLAAFLGLLSHPESGTHHGPNHQLHEREIFLRLLGKDAGHQKVGESREEAAELCTEYAPQVNTQGATRPPNTAHFTYAGIYFGLHSLRIVVCNRWAQRQASRRFVQVECVSAIVVGIVLWFNGGRLPGQDEPDAKASQIAVMLCEYAVCHLGILCHVPTVGS